jgi:hypothetical protein
MLHHDIYIYIYIYHDILKIFAKVLFCSVKCHFKALCLFETKSFIVKVVNNFQTYIFYTISFLINFLWACVDMFKAVCRSIEP